jgi:hypothetical protein
MYTLLTRYLNFGPFFLCRLILKINKLIFHRYLNINELNDSKNKQRSCLNDIQITESPFKKRDFVLFEGEPDFEYLCVRNC